jgi:hypothetical protein
VGFVVDEVALRQVLSEYFGLACKSLFYQFSILTITRGRYNRPEVADFPSGTVWIPPPTMQIKKLIKKCYKLSSGGIAKWVTGFKIGYFGFDSR